MTTQDFKLFPFQEEAGERLRSAALAWVAKAVDQGVPHYGTTPIPFVGKLRAVTGSGKTPILASVIAGLGDAVVIWTTKSSAVVEQTYLNLRGRYASLLGSQTRIVREIPSQADWRQLIDGAQGLTIWIMTTAQWNEAESAAKGGSADARLNLHRPQPDWAGPDSSPWEQLRTTLRRPLWVVADESHNQSLVQLDQLSALRPIGFMLASATPVQNELFDAWSAALTTDPEWSALAAAGAVPIRTRDVVEADLLKTTIEVADFNSGTEESLDGALLALQELDAAVVLERASVTPKAVYVVEKSNPPRGSQEEARPLVIWRHLISKGVDPDSIAVYTDTRDLPEEVTRVSSLTQLGSRHRHIIFNQSLQEGWDDPEAYVCYFDGVTKSFVRIRQIVGRVLRQPQARRFLSEELNTATLVINTPAESYEKVLDELRAELLLYAPEDEPGRSAVRVKTRKDPLAPVPVKREQSTLSLPRRALKAPDMTAAVQRVRSRGKSPWAQEFLDAPGLGRRSIVSLEDHDMERVELINVLRSARTQNGVYLRRRIMQQNRTCLNAIHPDHVSGPAFDQFSCQGSQAQIELQELATKTTEFFEARVEYQEDPDPDRVTWIIGEHRPRSKEMLAFTNAAHSHYSRSDFNGDERSFGYALDELDSGVWARNPSTPELGFGIPLPTKVGDSTSFYPDFLWWVRDVCWAIDTTGRHLLNEKVRGKLIPLENPRVALVTRGHATLEGDIEGKDGWTVVLARKELKPLVEYTDDLANALKVLLLASDDR